jgi:hypothetical protein
MGDFPSSGVARAKLRKSAQRVHGGYYRSLPSYCCLMRLVSLANAVRECWVTPPALPGDDPPPRKPIMSFRELMRESARDREGR